MTTSSALRGRFVVIEGGDGVGKSTQVAEVVAQLQAKAIDVIATREPGGTPLGEELRALLTTQHAIAPVAEALLISAARAQHCAQVIVPALEKGIWVVSDRFDGSFLAYQGYGRGLPIGDLEEITRFSTSSLRPDLVILLISKTSQGPYRTLDENDRFEGLGNSFHDRVAAGFLELAERFDWGIVGASGTISEVTSRIMALVEGRLGLAGNSGESQ